ncbi:mitochondrial processing insulinase-like metalloprotease [Cryptosporidium ubiquitum]|uniref:Mitochondrial processing insulinase-like metalloprotease n=1 Tax=Cryptosporidium ubiquitum TaxID=857276 RepID=A0A1J4MIJ4_9CRYT|nr:mitochondrial processing insulinase-like metalloprotease [Cryptosporidium ubiquitum]OII74082.1 mitochondrial processing insulinase-like metalloprotease [Cryptosporidium ubiquitum]
MIQRIRLFRHAFKNINTQILRTKRPVFSRINSLSGIGNREIVGQNGIEPIFSELSNGMRVITIDNNKKIASLGVILKLGSRFESKNSFGSSRVLFNMILSPEGKSSRNSLANKLASNGLMLAGCFDKEYVSFILEYLKDQGMENTEEFLDGIFKFYTKKFNDEEIEITKKNVKEELLFELENPSIMLNELLHSTAWKENSLGKNQALFLDQFSSLNTQNLTHFRNANLFSLNTVIVGTGIRHDQLIKKIMSSSKKFNILEKNSLNNLENNEYNMGAPKYVGGLVKNKLPHYGFTNTMVAFETNLNWKGREFVALSVLQAYLGGGSSFSVGGPGKGMYSKLFLDVLNKFDWVESCNCFVNQYTGTGLFGIHVTSYPGYSLKSIKIIAEQFGEMKNISERELERAKNLVLSTIYSAYENKSHYMEEISKQILSYSEYIELDEIVNCIKSIGIEDIKKVVHSILSNADRPTVIVVGTDVNQVPDYNYIVSIISRQINNC